MFAAKLFLAVVLVWSLNTAEGCTCIPMNTQKHFCKADFVTLALIQGVSEKPKEYQVVYNLLRIIHFRETEPFKNSTDNKGATFSVDSNIDSGACGANLGKVGDYILVSGYVSRNGKINTSLCDWNEKFMSLPRKTMNELFDGSYRDTCYM